MSRSQAEPAEELLGNFFPGKSRWVFPLLLAFFCLFFLLAWLIRYPDVVSIRVLLRPEGGVERYFAEVPGRIAALPVENGQKADSGAVVLVWENGAGWQDVLSLGALPPPADETALFQIDLLDLGPLEAQWVRARNSWDNFRSALQTLRVSTFSATHQRQLGMLDSMGVSLRKQAETLGREMELAKTTWLRNQKLISENAVSQEDLTAAESAYLEKKAQSESVQLEIHRNALQREGLENEQTDRALLDDKELRQKKEQWEADWGLLLAQREAWIDRSLILARRPGTVIFSGALEEQQWVDEGTPLLAIRSEGAGDRWMARGWLPAAGAGRVREGAETRLRLDAFPYEEYGSLAGTLAYISPLAENESFLVEIELPDSLITDTGKSLSPGPEMPATARIYSSKKRLIQRMLEGLKRL